MKAVATAAILDAAEKVMAEQGADGARMEEIARQAGMAVGTVYNYFADREALMTALRVERKRQLFEALESAIGQTEDDDFEDQLRAFLRAMLGFYEAHRQLFVLLLSSSDGRAKVQRTSAELLKEVYGIAEKLVRSGVKQGVIRTEYAELCPALLFAMVRGTSLAELHRKRNVPLTDLVEPLVDLFLHGAAKRR
jgi:AcrR family transcriptional regulator